MDVNNVACGSALVAPCQTGASTLSVRTRNFCYSTL